MCCVLEISANSDSPPFFLLITHPGVALLWVPTLGGAPARAPGGCVFEEQVGVGVRYARDRCTGTGGWVVISRLVFSVPKANCQMGLKKQNRREENILLAS